MARKTFLNDCWRQLFVGLSDTGARTFFLIIAVQRFSAGDLYKTLVTIPGAVGMALSVVLVPALARHTRRKNVVLAASRLLTGLAYLAAAAFPSLESYVFWIFVGGLPTAIVYPLLTAVYQENYPRRMRGRLFAWASMVHTGSSILFHALIGAWLGTDSGNYRGVLLLFAVTSFAAAWSLWGMPSKSGREAGNGEGRKDGNHRGNNGGKAADGAATGADPADTGRLAGGLHYFAAIRWVWKDRMFGYMLGIWFIFGFAAMMIGPLKVLYLTEPRYGMAYTAATVALIVGILPEATRLVTTPVWAHLFDRYNFVGIRMFINFSMMAAYIAFFWGRTFPWLCVSAVMEGLVLAGGNIAWALWVTHVAPVKHTAEYMAVHQFFTGVRGVIGAFLGIQLASSFGLQPVAWAAVGLVILSIVLMAPARHSRRWVRAEGGSDQSA